MTLQQEKQKKEYQQFIKSIRLQSSSQNIQQAIDSFLIKKLDQLEYYTFFKSLNIIIKKYGFSSLLYYKDLLQQIIHQKTFIRKFKQSPKSQFHHQFDKFIDLVHFTTKWKSFHFFKQFIRPEKNYKQNKLINSDIDHIIIEVLEKTQKQYLWQSDKIQQKLKKHQNKNLNIFAKYAIQFAQLLEDIPTPNKKILETNYFYQDQILQQNQNNLIEYKDYHYPIKDTKLNFILKKTVCGFLNYLGGTIFLGIKQVEQTRKKIVKGMQLSQKDKEELVKYLNTQIFQKISPSIKNKIDIEKKQLICKNPSNKKKYIIKIKVQKGDLGHLYHIYQNNKMITFIRNDHQIIKYQNFQQFYNLVRERTLQLLNN